MKSPIALGLMSVLLATSVFAEPESPPRSVTVMADGKVETEPDYVEVVFAVAITKTNAAVAKSEVDAVFTKLTRIFDDLEIKSDDVNTTRMYIAPEYRYVKDTVQFEGYEVNRRAHVTLRDVDKLEALLQRAVEAGVTHTRDVELRHSREDEFRKQALENACAAANSKAALLAAQFGAKVGPVRQIGLSDTHSAHFDGFAAADPFAAAEPTPSTYRFGKIDIRADVRVTFDLITE